VVPRPHPLRPSAWRSPPRTRLAPARGPRASILCQRALRRRAPARGQGIMEFEMRGGRRISRAVASCFLLTVVFLNAHSVSSSVACLRSSRHPSQFATGTPRLHPGLSSPASSTSLRPTSLASMRRPEGRIRPLRHRRVPSRSFPDWMGRIFRPCSLALHA